MHRLSTSYAAGMAFAYGAMLQCVSIVCDHADIMRDHAHIVPCYIILAMWYGMRFAWACLVQCNARLWHDVGRAR